MNDDNFNAVLQYIPIVQCRCRPETDGVIFMMCRMANGVTNLWYNYNMSCRVESSCRGYAARFHLMYRDNRHRTVSPVCHLSAAVAAGFQRAYKWRRPALLTKLLLETMALVFGKFQLSSTGRTIGDTTDDIVDVDAVAGFRFIIVFIVGRHDNPQPTGTIYNLFRLRSPNEYHLYNSRGQCGLYGFFLLGGGQVAVSSICTYHWIMCRIMTPEQDNGCDEIFAASSWCYFMFTDGWKLLHKHSQCFQFRKRKTKTKKLGSGTRKAHEWPPLPTNRAGVNVKRASPLRCYFVVGRTPQIPVYIAHLDRANCFVQCMFATWVTAGCSVCFI